MSEQSSLTPPGAGLAQRSAVAFSWGVAGSLAKILITLVVQAVLARLLGPTAFGLFALGILVMGVAGYFADIGLATSLVQRRDVSDSDIRFVLTLNVITAGAVGVSVIALAEPIAGAFGKPEVAEIFRWMAPVFLLNAVASVSTSLLRRQLDYRSIQLASLFGYVFGFGVVGIATAAWGGSVSALVAAYLAQSACTLALLYRQTKHTLGLGLRTTHRREFVGFGATVLLTNLINWLMNSLDRLMVGRLFPTATLGNYSVSYNLMVAPIGALYPNLQSTVFSSLARMQNDALRMRRAYLDLIRVVTIVFLPAFGGLYFFSDSLVRVVYGVQWAEAARLAGPFCIMAPFILVWACSTPVLWNTGQRAMEWKVQLPFIGLALLVIPLAASESILAVAWTMAALFVARALLLAALACRALTLGWRAMWLAVWPSVWMTAVVVSFAAVCAHGGRAAGLPVLAHTLLGAGVIGATSFAVILLAPDSLPPNVRSLIHRVQSRCPAWLKPLFNRLTGNHDQRA